MRGALAPHIRGHTIGHSSADADADADAAIRTVVFREAAADATVDHYIDGRHHKHVAEYHIDPAAAPATTPPRTALPAATPSPKPHPPPAHACANYTTATPRGIRLITRPIPCAPTLAAAVNDYCEAADGFSDDAEHAAGIDQAQCAEWLLDTRPVRIADLFARAGLRARASALRARTAAAVRLPRAAATATPRSPL
ncbi:hypothetical protein ACW9HR_37350 [Nocardia gipuzkoensis]